MTKDYRDSRAVTDKMLEDTQAHYEVVRMAVVHPVKDYVIKGIEEAVVANLIEPVLVGPRGRIEEAAKKAGVDISAYELVDVEHSHEAAEKSAAMAAAGEVESIMKGSLHSSEILQAIIQERGLRTERRLTHVYTMDIRTYPKPFFVTDGAINIAPDLKTKTHIIQNAANLWHVLYGGERDPKVAILAAVETINPDMQPTIDAAALCKMADRGQITGAVLDGPLAFDNAISPEAVQKKGLSSPVAGDADILVAPDLEAGNILAKQLTFMGEAEAAGIVLGARVPVILTSRADSSRTRLLSCALAARLAHARKEGKIK